MYVKTYNVCRHTKSVQIFEDIKNIFIEIYMKIVGLK